MRVNVDSKALSDPRITRLAARMKINRYEALGRLIPVWMAAYESRSATMLVEDADALSELRGFARAMIACDLATSSRGKLRLRGVEERIVFLLVNDAKREKALAAKRRLAAIPGDRPGGRRSDDASASKGCRPGGHLGGRPYSPDLDQAPAPDLDQAPAPDLDQAPAPDQDAEAGAAELGASSAAASPGGWTPPAGGRAEREARDLVAAGKLTPADVAACWEYLERHGIASDPPQKQDARAAGAIKKQRRAGGRSADVDDANRDYREVP
jgi:hypothetical protein